MVRAISLTHEDDHAFLSYVIHLAAVSYDRETGKVAGWALEHLKATLLEERQFLNPYLKNSYQDKALMLLNSSDLDIPYKMELLLDLTFGAHHKIFSDETNKWMADTEYKNSKSDIARLFDRLAKSMSEAANALQTIFSRSSAKVEFAALKFPNAALRNDIQ